MPKIQKPPHEIIGLVATYPKGNYSISGKYGGCQNPQSNYSTSGDFQRIEVYDESVLDIYYGSPNNGCTPIRPHFYFFVFGLNNNCVWVDLFPSGISTIANVSIIKNYDISGDGCAACSDDSCRVDCIGQPDGFCCIDHSLTDRLLQVLAN